MKSNRPGIWEWFDENGIRRLVEVFNCSPPNRNPYLRVYWWGGYYNVNDEYDLENSTYHKAEWADRWGERVSDNNALPDSELYLRPTPNQRSIYKL